MSIRDDMAERLFYVFQSAIRFGLCTHDEAKRAYAAATFLSGGQRFGPLFVRLGETKGYPEISKLRGPPARRKFIP